MTGGSTMAEKVMARVARTERVLPGEYITATIDKLMCHEAFVVCLQSLQRLGIDRLANPSSVYLILDHFFPAPTVRHANGHRAARHAAERLGIEHFLGHRGICHQVMVEEGHVLPGELILGTDSHSTTYGALGAAGAGIGFTEMTYALATGELWMQVPETIRIDLVGTPTAAVTAKDVVLAIAGRWGTDVANYRSIEFGGSVATNMSVESRMTMSNMGVELGAKFAMFPADAIAIEYLRDRNHHVAPFASDSDAAFAERLVIDVGELTPMVACPSSPGNVKPIADVVGRRIDQAFLGSCTNARLEDLAMAAEILDGHVVHPNVRLIVTPASKMVFDAALASGVIATLSRAGAHITAPGCGACPGGHNGVVGDGEVCISTSNRNFPGRMGSPTADVYLASPAVVAASAIAGHIADPRDIWDAVPLAAKDEV
jgi:3-isopropylmalate/(R)-2-methylmalate dehydratase large subunit